MRIATKLKYVWATEKATIGIFAIGMLVGMFSEVMIMHPLFLLPLLLLELARKYKDSESSMLEFNRLCGKEIYNVD